MRILIIANSRYKGGMSGSDSIYESFKQYWPCDVDVWDMVKIEFRPFFLCYLYRILLSVFRVFSCRVRYDLVYSASDFLPDSLPCFIFKVFRKSQWVAGFYLKAFKDNPVYYYSQLFAQWLITKFADKVIVTNPTMYHIFPDKKKTWINGGIDVEKAGLTSEHKVFDAVFCGRIHPSKGIDEMIDIWQLVRERMPNASLAIIGDGDLGKKYIKTELFRRNGLNNYNGVTLFGYMGDERWGVYKKSKVVLYPTPLKYDHFSMAPVEAMACGCPIICWETPVMKFFQKEFGLKGGAVVRRVDNKQEYADCVVDMLKGFWKGEVLNAFDWSSQFAYEAGALRVYEFIKGFDNRGARDVGYGVKPNLN